MTAPELELPDDADAKRQTLAELVAYRRQVLNEAAAAVMARIEACDDEHARIGLGAAHYVLTDMAGS